MQQLQLQMFAPIEAKLAKLHDVLAHRNYFGHIEKMLSFLV